MAKNGEGVGPGDPRQKEMSSENKRGGRGKKKAFGGQGSKTENEKSAQRLERAKARAEELPVQGSWGCKSKMDRWAQGERAARVGGRERSDQLNQEKGEGKKPCKRRGRGASRKKKKPEGGRGEAERHYRLGN